MDLLKETCVLWALQPVGTKPIISLELHLRLDQHLWSSRNVGRYLKGHHSWGVEHIAHTEESLGQSSRSPNCQVYESQSCDKELMSSAWETTKSKGNNESLFLMRVFQWCWWLVKRSYGWSQWVTKKLWVFLQKGFFPPNPIHLHSEFWRIWRGEKSPKYCGDHSRQAKHHNQDL